MGWIIQLTMTNLVGFTFSMSYATSHFFIGLRGLSPGILYMTLSHTLSHCTIFPYKPWVFRHWSIGVWKLTVRRQGTKGLQVKFNLRHTKLLQVVEHALSVSYLPQLVSPKDVRRLSRGTLASSTCANIRPHHLGFLWHVLFELLPKSVSL